MIGQAGQVLQAHMVKPITVPVTTLVASSVPNPPLIAVSSIQTQANIVTMASTGLATASGQNFNARIVPVNNPNLKQQIQVT